MVKRLISGTSRGSNPTMQDIATRAGVSAATVSYVLNAKPGMRVSDETRRRVLDVAERLHYRPNAIARAMASGRSHTIGVYQPHAPGAPMSGMWANDVLRGVGETLHARGYHLLLYGYRESEGPPPSAFLDGRNDGLIILAPHEDDVLPAALAKNGHPMVIVGGRHVEGLRSYSVDTDHVRGGALAAEYLIALGHRKIALLQGPPNVPNALDRRRGFEGAMLRAGLDINPGWISISGFSFAGGKQAFREIWCGSDLPTAVCAANDVSAMGVLDACSEMGVRVPEDLSLVGYDDTPVCQLAQPPLNSVCQPAHQMGSTAAERLIAALEGRSEPASTLFEPELVSRKSCRAVEGRS